MEISVKHHTADLLRKKDFEPLLVLCATDRRFWQEVRFRLYDLDDGLRWSAIETVAQMMQRWWKAGQEEKVRNYIRTLFWSLSDESGGIGWSSAQTIAEIIAHIPELIEPYGRMMIAYTIEEPPLIKGGLWGIGRLGEKLAGAVGLFTDKVLAVFAVDDSEILGIACWALGEACFKPALPFLRNLRERKEMVTIYMQGTFSEKPLGKWAEESISKILRMG
jgi:hypothetical protein